MDDTCNFGFADFPSDTESRMESVTTIDEATFHRDLRRPPLARVDGTAPRCADESSTCRAGQDTNLLEVEGRWAFSKALASAQVIRLPAFAQTTGGLRVPEPGALDAPK